MKKLVLIFCSIACFSASVSGQEIKTTVKESGFDLKPDPVKEEVFEEARTFVFTGIGWGHRTGNVVSGFVTNTRIPPIRSYKSTDYKQPFQNGLNFDLGFRYFLENNFGLGLRGNYFSNNAKFTEVDKVSGMSLDAKAKTRIFQGNLEALYRRYLSSDKTAFVYGALGLGMAHIEQEQEYRDNRITTVSMSTFLVRPAVGINVPMMDIFHFYSEASYGFSQGDLNGETLSLSQIQLTAGVHFRLNSF